MEGAKAPLRRAVDSDDVIAAPSAAGVLGMVLASQGDIAGAKAAYQIAIDSELATESAALAAERLGDLLASQGDLAGAKNRLPNRDRLRTCGHRARGSVSPRGVPP